MLDDENVLKQRDPSGALDVAARQYEQALFSPEVVNPEHDERTIENIVITGMGGSTLAALLLKTLQKERSSVPIEVVRSYSLPAYVGERTLVIASSYSGNTEETVSALDTAVQAGAQIAIITAGGKLAAFAGAHDICHIILPTGFQPRMTTIYGLIALLTILNHFSLGGEDSIREIKDASEFLKAAATGWSKSVTIDKNYAKQLALLAVGKTPVFYGGEWTAPLAYKWKISWNENAKNVAFWNEYPEFNHNEFMGWTSHPIEKPFVIFDLVSNFEHPQVLKRFAVSDRLLSGRRPKANVVNLDGQSLIVQLIWGCILADFTSIYVAILNGVDPTPVDLIEKLKSELA
jgi:glucose/mannose-6-phosphate isomerase